jgi:predicted transcriptional regulator
MGTRPNKSKGLMIRLPQPLRLQLDALARKTGRTRSDLAREALTQYLDRHQVARSCYDAAKEAGFLGCVEGGPDELSVSAVHCEAFGRD